MKKLYFAHPICEYGTKTESDILQTLQREFPTYKIVNPADAMYQKLCGKDMNKYLDLVRTCDAILGVPFMNNEWGAGVYAEMMAMKNKGGLVFGAEFIPYIENMVCQIFVADVTSIRPLSIQQTQVMLSAVDWYKRDMSVKRKEVLDFDAVKRKVEENAKIKR
jgi:hypothetical protein